MVDIPAIQKQFYGRDRIVKEIVSGLEASQPLRFSLIGSNLVGKTTILQYLASEHGPLLAGESSSRTKVVAYADCSSPEVQRHPDRAITARLERQSTGAIEPAHGGNEVCEDRSGGPCTWDITQRILESGMRPILLLDNLDSLVMRQSEDDPVLDAITTLGQEIPIVVTSRQPLFDLNTQQLSPWFVDSLTPISVGLMEPSVGLAWVESLCPPKLFPVVAELAQMTGMHPFLLERLGYTLAGVQEMLTPDQTLNVEHLPLIRLRLSEQGRRLFARTWQDLQDPPRRVDLRTLMTLLEQFRHSPIPSDEVTAEQTPVLNWLIDQTVVVYGESGYQIACPLFVDFLNSRIGPQARASRPSVDGDASPLLSNLTKTENALLRYFQKHDNVVVSTDDLLADVWHRPDASPRRVQEAIRRLRLRLDDAVPPVGAIHNERGRGYRFVPARF